jgi:MFS family permease
MAAASAGLLFINGLGAITGPVITGWIMAMVGPRGFFLFMAILFAVLAIYALWRMSRRRHSADATSSFTAVSPSATMVFVEAAMTGADNEGPEAEGNRKD